MFKIHLLDFNKLQKDFAEKPIHIHKQIFTNHFILLLFSILLFCFCLGTLAVQTILTQTSKYNYDNLHYINNQTDAFFEKLEENLHYIASKQELRSSLVFYNQFKKINELNLNFNTKDFIDYFLGLENGYELTILDLNQVVKTDPKKTYNTSFDLKSENWYNDFIKNKYTKKIISNSAQNYYLNGENVISFIVAVQNYTEDQTIGFLILDMSYNTIKNLYTNKISPAYPIIVLDENNNLIFSSESLSEKMIDKVLYESKYIVKEGKVKFGKEKYLISKWTSDFTDWKILSIISINKQLGPFAKLTLILTPIILLIILLDTFISLNTSKKIVKPINDLITSMKNTEQGYLKQNQLPKTHIYEIDELSATFENMMDEINYLVDKNEKINLLRVESQLNALQQKIDPHFLFNTLELISGQAVLENAKFTSKMTQKLGNLFRYNLRAPDMLTIQREINYVKDYLYLQQLRFNNSLNIKFDIENQILCYKIPKLTLQPLIENSINHGFKNLPSDDNYILIKGIKLEDKIIIEIIDNGEGISSKKLNQLNNSLKNDTTNFQYFIDRKEHIGIRNVNARICLYYKTNYGLKIDSIPHNKTKVTIFLPILMAR